MIRSFFISAFLLALIVVAGSCQSSGNSSHNVVAESGTPLATIRRSGGLLFNDDQVFVYPDGNFTIKHLSGQRAGSAASDKLPPDAMSSLTSALQATAALNSAYPHPPGFEDSYDYSLVYKGRTITWGDASPNVPPALEQIGNLFNGAFLIAAERERTREGQ